MRGDEREIDDRLADWVDGCMSERDRERFVAELRVNPQLQKDLAEYEHTVRAVRAALQAPTVLASPEARDRLADAVMARIHHGEPVAAPAPVVRSRPFALLWSLAAAAALFAVAILLDRLPSPAREDVADAVAPVAAPQPEAAPLRSDSASQLKETVQLEDSGHVTENGPRDGIDLAKVKQDGSAPVKADPAVASGDLRAVESPEESKVASDAPKFCEPAPKSAEPGRVLHPGAGTETTRPVGDPEGRALLGRVGVSEQVVPEQVVPGEPTAEPKAGGFEGARKAGSDPDRSKDLRKEARGELGKSEGTPTQQADRMQRAATAEESAPSPTAGNPGGIDETLRPTHRGGDGAPAGAKDKADLRAPVSGGGRLGASGPSTGGPAGPAVPRQPMPGASSELPPNRGLASTPTPKPAAPAAPAPTTGSDDFYLGSSRRSPVPEASDRNVGGASTVHLPSLTFTAAAGSKGGESSPQAGGGGGGRGGRGREPETVQAAREFFRTNLRPAATVGGLEPQLAQADTAVTPPAIRGLRFVDVTGRLKPEQAGTTASARAVDAVPGPSFVERQWLVEGRTEDVQALVRQLSSLARGDAVALANGEVDLLPAPAGATPGPGSTDTSAGQAGEAGAKSGAGEAGKPTGNKDDDGRGDSEAPRGGAAPTMRLVLRFRVPSPAPDPKR